MHKYQSRLTEKPHISNLLYYCNRHCLPKSTKKDVAIRKEWMIDNGDLVKKYVRAIINIVDDRLLLKAQ